MKGTFHRLLAPTGLLAAALLLPLPGMAVNCEKNPSHPSCSGDGGGGTEGATYTVAVKADPAWIPIPGMPTYAPADLVAEAVPLAHPSKRRAVRRRVSVSG